MTRALSVAMSDRDCLPAIGRDCPTAEQCVRPTDRHRAALTDAERFRDRTAHPVSRRNRAVPYPQRLSSIEHCREIFRAESRRRAIPMCFWPLASVQPDFPAEISIRVVRAFDGTVPEGGQARTLSASHCLTEDRRFAFRERLADKEGLEDNEDAPEIRPFTAEMRFSERSFR